MEPLVPARSLHRRGERTNAGISPKAIDHPRRELCARAVRRARLCVAGAPLSPSLEAVGVVIGRTRFVRAGAVALVRFGSGE
jgi:hypothetical protein